MAHPYKQAAHKSDPGWVKDLNVHVERAKKDDVDAVIRNYGGDKNATMQAARYARPKSQD
ncbi:hypothetical protein [Candidatus Methylomirabilis sp.]|uniref:hypothetical protein n=1 Tax=Candidatus Methylomirabilis sp. TaxID=2032687 RepID=UPI003C72041F